MIERITQAKGMSVCNADKLLRRPEHRCQVVHLRLKSIYKAFQQSNATKAAVAQASSIGRRGGSSSGDKPKRLEARRIGRVRIVIVVDLHH